MTNTFIIEIVWRKIRNNCSKRIYFLWKTTSGIAYWFLLKCIIKAWIAEIWKESRPFAQQVPSVPDMNRKLRAFVRQTSEFLAILAIVYFIYGYIYSKAEY